MRLTSVQNPVSEMLPGESPFSPSLRKCLLCDVKPRPSRSLSEPAEDLLARSCQGIRLLNYVLLPLLVRQDYRSAWGSWHRRKIPRDLRSVTTLRLPHRTYAPPRSLALPVFCLLVRRHCEIDNVRWCVCHTRRKVSELIIIYISTILFLAFKQPALL